MKHSAFRALYWSGIFFITGQSVPAAPVVSDGSDGAFEPSGSQTLVLNDLAPDGVFHFTTIHIPAGVTISFVPNDLNTPVFFAATGDVIIEGTVNMAASHFSRSAGPGGGAGGLASSNAAGSDGEGLSPGLGGPVTANQGNGGGGGGMATPGLMATSRTGSNPGAGGGAIARPELVPTQSGGGGSGGGGGGGRLFFGVDIPGGVGGGGGGALQISTPGNVTLAGKLLAGGAHGAWAFANIFAHGGPGGGGAGGQVELYASTVTITATAVVNARGGAGGGLSTETVPNDPYRFSSGANGGQGFLYIGAPSFTIAPGASVDAAIIRAFPIAADYDVDGDVDLDDYGVHQLCAAGANVTPPTPDCAAWDLDGDLDVDQSDFGLFQVCYSGSSLPADPNCVPGDR